MGVWDFVEGVTGRKREEIMHVGRVVAGRVIGSWVCQCGHVKGLHKDGEGRCCGKAWGDTNVRFAGDLGECNCSGFVGKRF